MEHVIRNEEDAITFAVENHTRAYGMGDARIMARVVVKSLAEYRARAAAEQIAALTARAEHLAAAVAAGSGQAIGNV